jgi:hypothetical protein
MAGINEKKALSPVMLDSEEWEQVNKYFEDRCLSWPKWVRAKLREEMEKAATESKSVTA